MLPTDRVHVLTLLVTQRGSANADTEVHRTAGNAMYWQCSNKLAVGVAIHSWFTHSVCIFLLRLKMNSLDFEILGFVLHDLKHHMGF